MPSVSRRYAAGERRFERPSGREDPETRGPVVLMVSGGADSTALLVLAATSVLDVDDGRGAARIAKERLHVLHVNHGLRGIDAQEDEEFVCELAERYGIPCTVVRAQVADLARKNGDNVENAGRELRYAEAVKLANRLCAEFGTPRSAARILTAHTADDRAETFFMNAIRGTGASGLSSIPRRRNRIVRPLLDRTHDELCELLRMRGIVWREDATNKDTHYLRAFVRHEVLPVVKERNPRVVQGVSTTCDILSDEDAYMESVAARALRDLTRGRSDGLLVLDAARLAATEVAVARRVVRSALLSVCPDARLEARHIAAVLQIVAAQEGSVTVPMALDARASKGVLTLRARASRGAAEPLAAWLEVPGNLELPDGRMLRARVRKVPAGEDAAALARFHGLEWAERSVLLDAAAAGIDSAQSGRLWVGSPQAGDVICPLGMHGQSKKLSDLLGESGLSLEARPQVPVVRTSPSGEVLWLAGIRASENARCMPDTRLFLELTLE